MAVLPALLIALCAPAVAFGVQPASRVVTTITVGDILNEVENGEGAGWMTLAAIPMAGSLIVKP